MLEHKTYDSKREMDILDALQEVKLLNKRRHKESFNPDKLLLEIMSKYDNQDRAKFNADLATKGIGSTMALLDKKKTLGQEGEEKTEF